MKYNEVSEEVQSIFAQVLSGTSLPKFLQFRLLSSEKLKDCYKVQKTNDLYETITEGLNIVIIINEKIFDQLNPEQQLLIMEEALTSITVNLENDKITIERPDIFTFSSYLAKYGDSTIIRLKETVKSLVDAIEREERDAKQARAEKRTNKKNKMSAKF